MMNFEKSIDPLTVPIPAALAATGVSRATLYRLAGTGRIRMLKSGRRTLVLWSSVQDYVASLPEANIRAA